MKYALMVVCIFCLISSLMLLPVGAAHAQDGSGSSSLRLSESAINTGIRANNTDPNNDLSIDLQPGQIVVNLASTGQGGNVTRFGLTLVPSVTAGGRLDLQATRLTINELELDLNNSNPAVNRTAGGINDYLSEQVGGGQITAVTVTDSDLTIEWRSGSPDDPIITLQDNLLSLTFSEASINRLPWVIAPNNPSVNSITVDLQPGQAVINTTQNVEPANVSYTLTPTIINGRVSWQIDATADIEGTLTSAVATVWRAYFEGTYCQDGLIEASITDNAVTFTWDLNANAPATQEGEPVVTYTIAEAEVNAAFAAYTNAELQALAVDMQPGQVLLRAVGVGSAGNAYDVAMVLIPSLNNGKVTWTTQSVTLNGVTFNTAAQQLTAAITDGLDNSTSATVTSFQVTDTEMTFTVRYR